MRWARSIALVALIAAAAEALPEEGRVSLVPWKVVAPGDAVDAPLVLYWIPATRDELRHSPLLTSDDLTLYSSRCVAMRVVRADDVERLAKLDVRERPAVVLVDGEERIIGVAESLLDVEELVRQELDARAEAANLRLDRARRYDEEGDEDGALALYRSVWEERCMCPRQAKAAQRAMKKIAKK
ncbi:MAG TPA: hypothetical protein VM076_11360 [Gemmatimonadaceae bacterium]|nr:hypothetical protein [Gemmatimonadaceae bacterium]